MTRHECHRVHAGVIGPPLNDGRNPMTQNLRHGLIYVIADGSEQTRVTSDSADDLRPAW